MRLTEYHILQFFYNKCKLGNYTKASHNSIILSKFLRILSNIYINLRNRYISRIDSFYYKLPNSKINITNKSIVSLLTFINNTNIFGFL